MISKLGPLPSAAAISSTSGAMLPASLRTGTTIETAGGAALARVSLMIYPTWPHPRPQDADGHGGRERIDGMAGRQACVFNAPAERAVNERVRTSLDKWSRAADQALPDGEDQARQTDRKEQKPEPHGDCSEHALGHARKRRRGEQRDRGKRKRDRH